jgi:hypothetical protein
VIHDGEVTANPALGCAFLIFGDRQAVLLTRSPVRCADMVATPITFAAQPS